jgi:hypothetical protein
MAEQDHLTQVPGVPAYSHFGSVHVDIWLHSPAGAADARTTGGAFGGSVIALVPAAAVSPP